MKKSLSKDLLFDFFDGKTTPIQRKLIEEWLSDADNEELYYQYLDEWESQRIQFVPRSEQAFEAFEQLLQQEAPATSPTAPPADLPRRWFPTWTLWAVAASLALVAGFLFRDDIRYRTYETTYGQRATHRLPDGSRVTLNANSVLRVPRFEFGRHGREVRLEGEAEFNVTHTTDHSRFVVHTDRDFRIEVLGTEFVVYSRERGKRVYLTRGKVKLLLPQGRQLYMKPGNLATFEQSGRLRITNPEKPRPLTAWKEHWFYFDNTPLEEVAIQIKEQFGLTVVIPDSSLARRRIAGGFQARQADDLLQAMVELLGIEVVRQGDQIELQPPKPF